MENKIIVLCHIKLPNLELDPKPTIVILSNNLEPIPKSSFYR